MHAYKPFRFFLTATESELKDYLLLVGILWAPPCEKCNQTTHLSRNARKFICRRRHPLGDCNTKISIYANTIFDKKKISLREIF